MNVLVAVRVRECTRGDDSIRVNGKRRRSRSTRGSGCTRVDGCMQLGMAVR